MTDKKPAFELEMDRVIDAPRARVYEAWTDPKQMTQWFAPKPFQLVVQSMDFRPGGKFNMAMRAPDGSEFPFTGTYGELQAPAKLSWSGEFTGGPANQMTTTVDLAEENGKTKIHVRQIFWVLTPQTEQANKGAKQGWAATLDQLEQFTKRAR